MILLLCELDECEVIAFTQGDEGGIRCPGCGFTGRKLRTGQGRRGYRRLVRTLLGGLVPC